MKTKIPGLPAVLFIMLKMTASAQQTRPYPNPIITPTYTYTITPTGAPDAPYSNPTGGSTTPYTTGPLQQQIAPPPAANPPPLAPPPNSMKSRTIIEPAHQPTPPPIKQQ